MRCGSASRPSFPPAPSHARVGRLRVPARPIFAALVYLLRTGEQWHALPKEFPASSTVHDRFQEWEQAGFFAALWQAGLEEYDEVAGIDWRWQAVAGVMTKAPFGGAATGANPTDRGKRGTKRSVLVDAAGMPLAAVVTTAMHHQYVAHVRRCGEERGERHPDGKARRWVVEGKHSWLNRSRRLLVRWEKKVANYLAFVHRACAQLLFARVSRVSG